METARLIAEAQEQQADLDSQEGVDEQMNLIIRDLASDFAVELRQLDGQCNRQAVIDSTYWRSSAIAGTPLTDGYRLPKPSPTTMGALTGRERTSTPASPVMWLWVPSRLMREWSYNEPRRDQ